jgi:hypothetical protein
MLPKSVAKATAAVRAQSRDPLRRDGGDDLPVGDGHAQTLRQLMR